VFVGASPAHYIYICRRIGGSSRDEVYSAVPLHTGSLESSKLRPIIKISSFLGGLARSPKTAATPFGSPSGRNVGGRRLALDTLWMDAEADGESCPGKSEFRDPRRL
jgi:hypothetical protein